MATHTCLGEQFLTFHYANPTVYQMFRRFALEAVASGMRRVSGRFLLERIRWHVNVDTTGAGRLEWAGRELKLNDHHSPFYVRLFLQERPDLIGRFEMRPSEADDLYPVPLPA